MNFLIILVQIILIISNNHCNTFNKSTYLIPDAKICLTQFDIGGDKYLFGPYKNNLTGYQHKCAYAKGRDKYCETKDRHFCPLIDSGIFINYFMVEC